MKRIVWIGLLLGSLAACAQGSCKTLPAARYDVRAYGAKGDGITTDTEAINAAIGACAAGGGGTVLFPSGTYLTGTLLLKNDVRLYLCAGAILQGTENLEQYRHYTPLSDVSAYDSGGSGQNANNSKDARWNRALILGVGISNASIEGEGTIDGGHLFDPLGEERMRGPHIVVVAESRNFSMSGITLNNASNYAFMAYRIENCLFRNLRFNAGWDGIHIRGGKNIQIRNCEFRTGDDAIAGGYWENMAISDCYVNSSCNGIRLIMPARGLTIARCTFQGPGRYPHRTSKERQRTDMLTAIFLQPGGWGRAPGVLDQVHIHDIRMDNLNTPLMFMLNGGNEAGRIVVERVRATRLNFSGATVESWKGGAYEDLTFRDISLGFRGNADPALRAVRLEGAAGDSRPLPVWGWYVANARNIRFERVRLEYAGQEARPAFWFENTGRIEFTQVEYPGDTDDGSVILLRSDSILKRIP